MFGLKDKLFMRYFQVSMEHDRDLLIVEYWYVYLTAAMEIRKIFFNRNFSDRKMQFLHYHSQTESQVHSLIMCFVEFVSGVIETVELGYIILFASPHECICSSWTLDTDVIAISHIVLYKIAYSASNPPGSSIH